MGKKEEPSQQVTSNLISGGARETLEMALISVFTDYLFPCLAGKLYLQRKCMDVGARSNLLVYFSVQRKLQVSLSDTPL